MGLPSTELAKLEPSMDVEVRSPCNGICTLDIQAVCKGCKRTSEEISRWYVMSNTEKSAVLKRIVGTC
jgi:uncharacterized protein